MKVLSLSFLFFISFSFKDFLPQREKCLHKAPSLNKENLKTLIYSLPLKAKDIILKQAYLETGHLKSRFCKEYNNLFGFCNGHGPLKFDSWQDCVYFYQAWQDKYYKGGDYLTFLKTFPFAEDSSYVQKLKRIRI